MGQYGWAQVDCRARAFTDRLQAAELDLEWQDVIADLDRVVETTVEQQGRRFLLRNQAPGCAGSVFHAVGVALPPLFRRLDAEKPAAPTGPQPETPQAPPPRTPQT